MPGKEGKMDNMDFSTLGDLFVSKHTEWNNLENAVGERYVLLTLFALLSPWFDFSHTL